MSQPTPAIPAIVKDTITDAITDARRILVRASNPEALAQHTDPAHPAGRSILVAAEEALGWLDWVHTLVIGDYHDPIMHLRIGEVCVTLRDIAPGIGRSGAVEAADRLKVAGLLLQQARRAATMDAVIRDIRSAAIDISAKAAGHIDDAIAKSIEAQANRIAQQARR